ncbi:MAG: response regulator [Pseudomonadota bacterium]
MNTDQLSAKPPVQITSLADRTCLVLDDDTIFRERLAKALTQVGFVVSAAGTVHDGVTIASHNPPAFAVVDLRLDDGFGLEVIEALKQNRPDAHTVVLTGYGALPNAVAAIKSGAQNVLAKPADIEDIVNSLLADPQGQPEPPESPTEPNQVRWEYIKSVFDKNDGNVSQTARVLNMHRRTLQRILQSHQCADVSDQLDPA